MGNIFSDIWERKNLLILMTLNDVKVRYRNSILGFFWTFLEPLLMLAVLYVVFTTIMKSEIANYPVFLFLGLIIWYMFSRATAMGLASLTDKSSIIQKIYFRREIVVLSASLTSSIMMGFEFGAFVFYLVILQFVPPLTALLLPLVLLDLIVLCIGISLILSVLNVYFKDIKFIWQIILQAGFFLSPIIYTMDMFPESVNKILRLNPLVPILDFAHTIILNNQLPSFNTVSYMIASTLFFLIVGYVIFRLKDKRIVEAL